MLLLGLSGGGCGCFESGSVDFVLPLCGVGLWGLDLGFGFCLNWIIGL